MLSNAEATLIIQTLGHQGEDLANTAELIIGNVLRRIGRDIHGLPNNNFFY